jgi:hypothetical protein
MDDEPIARYYDDSKNADAVYLPGVPLSDISESRWAAFPQWLQDSADAIGWYSATRPAVRKTAAVRAIDDQRR